MISKFCLEKVSGVKMEYINLFYLLIITFLFKNLLLHFYNLTNKLFGLPIRMVRAKDLLN